MENPEEAYLQELEKSRLKNETAPVVMGGSIEELFNKFIADDAPLSYQKYQAETGDKDVECTSWVDSSSSLGCTRDMRFLKPVAIPAMPFARALMVQRYQRFGDYGLTIASSTRMEDVPYCDFFTVEVLVTARATGEGELTLMTFYEVKFLQSTMFRRFIEGNTNPDVKKWNEEFVNHIKEVEGGGAAAVAAVAIACGVLCCVVLRWLPHIACTQLARNSCFVSYLICFIHPFILLLSGFQNLTDLKKADTRTRKRATTLKQDPPPPPPPPPRGGG
jgi:hypothetical protein